MTSRVLLVEDEPLIAMMLEDFLDALDRQCAGSADSVDAALPLVEAGGFDCAILDVNLRGEASFTAADHLLAAGVPFVFMTGYDASGMPDSFEGVMDCEKSLSTATSCG